MTAPVHPPLWAQVDAYLAARLLRPDAALAAAQDANAAAGLPPIDVTPLQGQLLHLLARSARVRAILEIGTLGGYSTICLARALPPEGRLLSLELNPRHAAVARQNLARAGLDRRVEIRVGPALESLAALQADPQARFDLVFIDADKVHTAEYFHCAVQLSLPGALILVDNVVRQGRLVDEAGNDPEAQGMRRFLEAVAAEPRVEATGLQTVCAKGHDGLVIARVRD